ncbi:MAG: hypothetical protein Q9222_000598 [Ikaeria aurantiellina]
MDMIQQANILPSNLFGVNLQRSSDGSADGELSFGSPDTTKYRGELSYTDTIADATMWEIPIDEARVGGRSCRIAGKTAIIDTGTSFVLLPPADARELHSRIPGTKEDGETYSIPCSTQTPIQLRFSGVLYSILPADYVGPPVSAGSNRCTSNIVGRQPFEAGQWLIGDVFLKNVYSVFDYDKERVGFAAKESSQQSTSSSLTTQPSALPSSTSKSDDQREASTSVTSGAVPSSAASATSAPSSVLDRPRGGTSISAAAQVDGGIHLALLNHANPEDLSVLEASSLLHDRGNDGDKSPSPDPMPASKPPSLQRRQSSLAMPSQEGIPRRPRTVNRVRFEGEQHGSNERSQAWDDEDDNISHRHSMDGASSTSQHAPLLTGIEAPSVTVANTDFDFTVEDLLESNRPKSGMRSAFMNMANSIM